MRGLGTKQRHHSRSPAVWPFVLGLLLLSTFSCTSPESPELPNTTTLEWGSRADSLPTLVPVLSAEAPTPASIEPRGQLAIGESGRVLAPTDRSGPDALAVIDTTGHVALTFGKLGPGPGELRWSAPIDIDAKGFVVFDMSQMKLVSFDATGTDPKEIRPANHGMVQVRTLLDDSTALVAVPDPEGGPVPATMSLLSGEVHTLVASSDSFLQTFRGDPTKQMLFTLGRWAGGAVIGNKMTYDLAFFDRQGRRVNLITPAVERPVLTAAEADRTLESLSSAPGRKPLTGADLDRARAKLMSEEQPFFSHIPTPTTDEQGRLWILGEVGDSGYADLFGRRGYLGRIPLPCPGFESTWAVRGHWLALACATTDSLSTAPGVLKIFRIEG